MGMSFTQHFSGKYFSQLFRLVRQSSKSCLLRGRYLWVRNCVNPSSCRVLACTRVSSNSLPTNLHSSVYKCMFILFFRPIVSGVDMKRTYYSITAAIADSCPVLLNGEALCGKSFCFHFLASRLGRFSGRCSLENHCLHCKEEGIQGFQVKEGLNCVLFRAIAAWESTQLSSSLTRKPCRM